MEFGGVGDVTSYEEGEILVYSLSIYSIDISRVCPSTVHHGSGRLSDDTEDPHDRRIQRRKIKVTRKVQFIPIY